MIKKNNIKYIVLLFIIFIFITLIMLLPDIKANNILQSSTATRMPGNKYTITDEVSGDVSITYFLSKYPFKTTYSINDTTTNDNLSIEKTLFSTKFKTINDDTICFYDVDLNPLNECEVDDDLEQNADRFIKYLDI